MTRDDFIDITGTINWDIIAAGLGNSGGTDSIILTSQANVDLATAGSAPGQVVRWDEYSSYVSYNLLQFDIKGTIQIPTIVNKQVTQILHQTGTILIRTDTFVYTTNLVTETRTLASNGDTLTYLHHMDTLQTEVI